MPSRGIHTGPVQGSPRRHSSVRSRHLLHLGALRRAQASRAAASHRVCRTAPVSSGLPNAQPARSSRRRPLHACPPSKQQVTVRRLNYCSEGYSPGTLKPWTRPRPVDGVPASDPGHDREGMHLLPAAPVRGSHRPCPASAGRAPERAREPSANICIRPRRCPAAETGHSHQTVAPRMARSGSHLDGRRHPLRSRRGA